MINQKYSLISLKKSEVIFDLEKMKTKVDELESITTNEDFWCNKNKAYSILKKIKDGID